MASRDYKDKGGPARGGRGTPARRGSPMAVGIAIGVLLGLGAALGVALYINKGPSPFTERRPASDASEPAPGASSSAKGGEKAAPPASGPAPKADRAAPGAKSANPPATPGPKPANPPATKSRSNDFTFYGILEGKEKVVDNPPLEAAPGTVRDMYLQVGAFHSAAEADDLKAQLALAGIEAGIQPVRLKPGEKLVHRVRLGPFTAEEAVLARNRLKQNKVDAIFVQKQPRAP